MGHPTTRMSASPCAIPPWQPYGDRGGRRTVRATPLTLNASRAVCNKTTCSIDPRGPRAAQLHLHCTATRPVQDQPNLAILLIERS